MYAWWGPFFTVTPLTDPATPHEYFRDLDIQEKPITRVLQTLFFGQVLLIGYLLVKSSNSQKLLIFSFGLVGIASSLLALIYAGFELYVGGIG